MSVKMAGLKAKIERGLIGSGCIQEAKKRSAGGMASTHCTALPAPFSTRGHPIKIERQAFGWVS